VIYSILLLVVVVVGIDTNNAFAQNATWLNWEDPDKQFSLQYPSDWPIRPRENRFEDQDVTLYAGGDLAAATNMTTLSINVINVPLSTDPSRDLKETMKATVESTTNDLNNIATDMKLFEGPEFDKYAVSGKPAGSAIWVINNPKDLTIDRAVLQFIGSIVGDKFVGIYYNSPDKQFDNYLPQIQKVIQSIKVK
jgi:hypothetical protein